MSKPGEAYGYLDTADDVVLMLTRADYDALTIMLGYATGAASQVGDKKLYWHFLALVNRINEGNPRYVPYEIPEAFR